MRDNSHLVVTLGIQQKLDNDIEFANQVQNSVDKFYSNDWGLVSSEDCEINNSTDNQYALGSYLIGHEKIWIIREHDGSAVTVLLPQEY